MALFGDGVILPAHVDMLAQVAVERAQVESDRDTTEEKLRCLRQLPGFSTKCQRDLLRMLLDQPLSVKSVVPQQTLFTAGAHMNQVRFPPKTLEWQDDHREDSKHSAVHG